MVYHEQKEQDWREQAAALQKRLDYYEQENARLQLQNEALHETAWQLIQRIRTLEIKNNTENNSKNCNILREIKKKDQTNSAFCEKIEVYEVYCVLQPSMPKTHIEDMAVIVDQQSAKP